jgi:hypothetical protein
MFNYLVLKHTKSELSTAISKLITKIDNFGLRIDMQNARQTKLGTVTGKPPKRLFEVRRRKCYPKLVPK